MSAGYVSATYRYIKLLRGFRGFQQKLLSGQRKCVFAHDIYGHCSAMSLRIGL